MDLVDAVRSELIGPGGPFEVREEEVRGRITPVYAQRMRSLREIPERARRRGDDRPFIVYGDRRIGFASFVDGVHGVATSLIEGYGVGKGDRVAILAQNSPEWCTAAWAAIDAGAIVVGLNGWWKTDEVLYGLRDSGARVLIADSKRLARIARDLGDCPDLDTVFLTDGDPGDFERAAGRHAGRIRHFAELETPVATAPDVDLSEDDPAIILYTSGTTGRPKGAVCTHRNVIACVQHSFFISALNRRLAGPDEGRVEGPTVSLFTSPLFHVSGLHSTLVSGLLAGLRLVMIEGRFDPVVALELIEREEVTLWATVPTMVWRVCEHPTRFEYDTSSVRTVAFGGSPSAEELQRKVRETFPNVRKGGSNIYGLTESNSAATVLLPVEAAAGKSGTVGRALPTVGVAIAGAGAAGPRAEGEVLLRGPTIMLGYWHKPEETAATIDDDGWLHTGDIGLLDEDGYLVITDRLKDMIIRGGENIYCVEIENRLVEHPAVADAAVLGVPHPTLGEEVKAVVQLEPGHELTEKDVQAWVAEALADFKVPTYVELREDKLPRNASGKLLKNALRGTGDVSFDETL